MSLQTRPKLIVTSTVFLVFGACASSRIALKPADRASIHSVSVQQPVSKPAEMYYTDLTAVTGAAFGGLVGALVASPSVSSGKALQNDADARGISIETITREAFTRELQRNAVLPLARSGTGDAAFRLKITQYGVTYTGMMKRALLPIVGLQAEMVRPNGTVICKATTVGSAAESTRHTFEEFHANPDLLRAGWADGAQRAAHTLLSDFKKP